MFTNAQRSRLRALRDKRHREAAALYVVENPKVVAELLLGGTRFQALYATAEWAPPEGGASAARIERIAPEDMARISHLPTPSPVFAVGRISRESPAPHEFDHGLTLALDAIQDPGNVGTLLRVADWFGFERVLLSADCADLFSQKVINASMGSFARVKTFTAELSEALTNVTVPIIGCDLRGDSVHSIGPLPDAVVVIGNEGRGLSDAVRSRISHYVTIPRHGHAESLNAGVAAAIVCDNIRRALK